MSSLETAAERLTREDAGYHKGLKNRQIQMIALGGAIGTGLFLGAGGRLASAGNGLFLVHRISVILVFLFLPAIGGARPVLGLRDLRHLRLPHPARARRTRAAPPVLGILRVLRPRILRREG